MCLNLLVSRTSVLLMIHEYRRETGMSFSYVTVCLPRFWQIVVVCLNFFHDIVLLHFLFVWIQHQHLFLHVFDLLSISHQWTSFLFSQCSYTYLYRKLRNAYNPLLPGITQQHGSSWRSSAFHRGFLSNQQLLREARATLYSHFIYLRHSCLQLRRQLII